MDKETVLMKHLKRNILAITLASMHIMGSGYNVDALETKTTSNNIVRTNYLYGSNR